MKESETKPKSELEKWIDEKILSTYEGYETGNDYILPNASGAAKAAALHLLKVAEEFCYKENDYGDDKRYERAQDLAKYLKQYCGVEK